MDIWLAWVAAIVTGVEAIVIKMASKSLVRSPWLFNILWLGFALPAIIVLAVLRGGGMPEAWFPIILTALSSFGFYVFYTLSIYKLDVTTISPLFSIRTVTAVILGLVLLGESISALGIALMIAIVAASPLTSFDEKLKFRAFIRRHTLLAVAAMISLAFMGYYTNRSVAANGYSTTILWQDLLTFVLLLPTIRLVRFEHETFSRKSVFVFVALGLCSFLYTATTTYAYAHALSLSSIIVSLPFSMILAWLLSFRFPELLEKHPPRVYAIRFTGAAVMVSSAIWLSLL
ncbi:EamA family transporter [Candidatus Saccharibacteria bacterium]|nr:MAG: EamA family transporter [Candidatus Saccharibacteria bacterium]